MRNILLAMIAMAFMACGDSTNEATKSEAKAQSVESNADSNKTAESNANKIDSNKMADSNKTAESNAGKIDSTIKTTNVSYATTAKTPQDLYKKCIACHGEKGDKIPPGSATNIVIADLDKKTLISDLKGYRAKTLSKGGTAAIMYLQANGLSDEDIETLGNYITTLKK